MQLQLARSMVYALQVHACQPAQIVLPARQPTLQPLERVLCWHAAAVGQAHAHRLDGAGHRVSCEHATASTGPRACVLDDVLVLCLADKAGGQCTCSPPSLLSKETCQSTHQM